MPVMENISLLFSSCHVELAISVNNKQKIDYFPSLLVICQNNEQKLTIFQNNKL